MAHILKRLSIYLKEMYPVPSRLLASLGLFVGIYATALFVEGKTFFHINLIEIIGILTVFGILLLLRIVDEFKDAETDKVNFPKRPLPSGRVHPRDLKLLAGLTMSLIIIANLLFMSNILYLAAVIIYGSLMSTWFFAKKYIQPNLLLALITHNPIQLLIVYYVISVAATTYDFSPFSPALLLVAFIFYLPGLAWELSRKIRAPKDEDQYVTYSQIFGRTRAIWIVMGVLLLQLLATATLFYQQAIWIVAVTGAFYAIYVGVSLYSIRHPEYKNYGSIARGYMYVFQLFIAIVSVVSIL